MSCSSYSRIVVKLGTSTLTDGTISLAPHRIIELVRQMAQLMDAGADVVLVSSGAQAVGSEVLQFPKIPKELPRKQMLSAIGQPRLMALYAQLFGYYGKNVAQVLLTRKDISRRSGFLNSRNTMLALLHHGGVVPIVNENDTVATDEIRVGDNDNLSAQVAALIGADLLIMLTDQNGVYTADPRINPDAELVSVVDEDEIPTSLWQAAGTGGLLGTGGMLTKLQAADLARRSGVTTVIANGKAENIIARVAAGENVGTRFTPVVTSIESRKRYILAGWDKKARLTIDNGAISALQQGSSLLPVGIRRVDGAFERGDTVAIFDQAQNEIARGLVNYTHQELLRILGQNSTEIEKILGYAYGDEAIHRDYLILK